MEYKNMRYSTIFMVLFGIGCLYSGQVYGAENGFTMPENDQKRDWSTEFKYSERPQLTQNIYSYHLPYEQQRSLVREQAFIPAALQLALAFVPDLAQKTFDKGRNAYLKRYNPEKYQQELRERVARQQAKMAKQALENHLTQTLLDKETHAMQKYKGEARNNALSGIGLEMDLIAKNQALVESAIAAITANTTMDSKEKEKRLRPLEIRKKALAESLIKVTEKTLIATELTDHSIEGLGFKLQPAPQHQVPQQGNVPSAAAAA